jgi:monoterpene epsilon-lactone hydrolase
MASGAARLARTYLKWRVKARLASAANIQEAAAVLDLPFIPAPRGLSAQKLGGVDGELLRPVGAPCVATLLYLHGGGFFAGSPRMYRQIARAFAARGFEVFTPAYRLAPRHPFPAALDDAKAAYAALAQRSAGGIVVAGDSAGGGLALSLMVALKADGAALPKSAALFSPWTDLAVTGGSTRENEGRDAIFSRGMLRAAARNYLAGERGTNPLASPLYADLSGLPPLLIHVGADELLRDDSLRLAQRAQESGVEARIEVWPGVPHGWQLAAAFMPEARRSLALAADFLKTPI